LTATEPTCVCRWRRHAAAAEDELHQEQATAHEKHASAAAAESEADEQHAQACTKDTVTRVYSKAIEHALAACAWTEQGHVSELDALQSHRSAVSRKAAFETATQGLQVLEKQAAKLRRAGLDYEAADMSAQAVELQAKLAEHEHEAVQATELERKAQLRAEACHAKAQKAAEARDACQADAHAVTVRTSAACTYSLCQLYRYMRSCDQQLAMSMTEAAVTGLRVQGEANIGLYAGMWQSKALLFKAMRAVSGMPSPQARSAASTSAATSPAPSARSAARSSSPSHAAAPHSSTKHPAGSEQHARRSTSSEDDEQTSTSHRSLCSRDTTMPASHIDRLAASVSPDRTSPEVHAHGSAPPAAERAGSDQDEDAPAQLPAAARQAGAPATDPRVSFSMTGATPCAATQSQRAAQPTQRAHQGSQSQSAPPQVQVPDSSSSSEASPLQPRGPFQVHNFEAEASSRRGSFAASFRASLQGSKRSTAASAQRALSGQDHAADYPSAEVHAPADVATPEQKDAGSNTEASQRTSHQQNTLPASRTAHSDDPVATSALESGVQEPQRPDGWHRQAHSTAANCIAGISSSDGQQATDVDAASGLQIAAGSPSPSGARRSVQFSISGAEHATHSVHAQHRSGCSRQAGSSQQQSSRDSNSDGDETSVSSDDPNTGRYVHRTASVVSNMGCSNSRGSATEAAHSDHPTSLSSQRSGPFSRVLRGSRAQADPSQHIAQGSNAASASGRHEAASAEQQGTEACTLAVSNAAQETKGASLPSSPTAQSQSTHTPTNLQSVASDSGQADSNSLRKLPSRVPSSEGGHSRASPDRAAAVPNALLAMLSDLPASFAGAPTGANPSSHHQGCASADLAATQQSDTSSSAQAMSKRQPDSSGMPVHNNLLESQGRVGLHSISPPESKAMLS
jgi:hypothetical protein